MTLTDVTAIIESLKADPDPLAALDARLASTRQTVALLESLRGLFGDGPGKSEPAPASGPSPEPRAGNEGQATDVRTQRRLLIARHIRQHGWIRISEAAKVTGVSRPTAQKDLEHPWFKGLTDSKGLKFALTAAAGLESTAD